MISRGSPPRSNHFGEDVLGRGAGDLSRLDRPYQGGQSFARQRRLVDGKVAEFPGQFVDDPAGGDARAGRRY